MVYSIVAVVVFYVDCGLKDNKKKEKLFDIYRSTRYKQSQLKVEFTLLKCFIIMPIKGKSNKGKIEIIKQKLIWNKVLKKRNDKFKERNCCNNTYNKIYISSKKMFSID
jgi:hypothetical protein